MPPADGPGLEKHKRDLFAIREKVAALARRAAEDGLKIKVDGLEKSDTRRGRKHNLHKESQRVLLDGPLSAELADPAAHYRKKAEAIFANVLEKGEGWMSWDYSGHALLPIDTNTFIAKEVGRLAGEAGVEVRWQIWDDIGESVHLVERRDEPS